MANQRWSGKQQRLGLPRINNRTIDDRKKYDVEIGKSYRSLGYSGQKKHESVRENPKTNLPGERDSECIVKDILQVARDSTKV